MSSVTIIELIAVFVLLCLSAFFSSAETTYFSLNPIQIHRIRRFRPKAARQIEQLLGTPTVVLSTILIGNMLVNIAIANLGFLIAERYLPSIGETVAIVVTTFVILMFGEVAPKRMAVRYAERMAVFYLPLVRGTIYLLAPARLLLDRITCSFDKYFQERPKSMTEAEFRTAVGVSQEEGILNREERVMVDGIIRLENLHARNVMTPRVDLIGIDIEAPIEESVEIARKSRLRYLPVYRGTLDHIEGFLDVFKFLLSSDHDIRASMTPHFYVPDTAPLDTLLTTFQQGNLHIAIVIDEYGGTAGLITRGDILEEIVQDAEREGVAGKLHMESYGGNRWLVDGTTGLEDINYQLDLKLEAEGAGRIAGWVSAQMGRLPKPGDVIEAQGCRATVLEMKRHRIRTILLEKL